MAGEIKALGRYRIDRVLGKGAMGVVYEGFDPRLSRRVAIKTILKAHLDAETASDYSQRFEREALAVARLNHPNIVQVHDFGEEGEVAFLVLEYIEGRELKDYFAAHERFDLATAVRVMGELCAALEFAHNAGIVHRDVKPANVMIDAQGRVKLTDFGVARVQEAGRGHATSTMVGTPAFMSPEQITGTAVDRRTDVFSAGVILYQMLTGALPFNGDGAWTIARQIMQDEPPRPSTLDTNVSPLFDAVVRKALAKKPDERYQSASELAAALRLALEGKPAEAGAAEATMVNPAGGAAPLSTRPPGPRAPAGDAALSTQGRADLEVEYWRSIKDGNDPADFELYLQQFPGGVYASLAKRKISKLRGLDDNTQTLVLGKGETPAGTAEKPAGGRRAMPAAIAATVVVALAIGAYYATQGSKPPPVPDVPAKAAPPAPDPQSSQKAAQEKAAIEQAARDKAAADQAKAAEIAAAKAAREKAKAAESAAAQAAADKAAAEKSAAAAAAARAAEDKARQDQLDAERRRQQAAIEEERRQMQKKLEEERRQSQAKLEEERQRLQQEQQRLKDAQGQAEKKSAPEKPAAKRQPAYVAPTF